MLNRVTLQGRLTADPELRRTQSGTAVTSFSLAVEKDFKDKDSGQRGVILSTVSHGSKRQNTLPVIWQKAA